MTDRELLELAAKAAGIELRWHPDGTAYSDSRCKDYGGVWNPLTDDGDALRLAATLKMNVDIRDSCAEVVIFVNDGCGVTTAKCYSGATRRAIVRAAAEIGKGML